MSLNQVYKNDVRKPWLDGRFENLTVDNILDFKSHSETDVQLTFTGPFASPITDVDCKIVKNGNIIHVWIDGFTGVATSQAVIITEDFPEEFMPTVLTTITPISVFDDDVERSGGVSFFDDSGTKVLRIVSTDTTTSPANFNGRYIPFPIGTGQTGIQPINFSYYLI